MHRKCTDPSGHLTHRWNPNGYNQSEPVSNGNEGVLHTPQISRAEVSESDEKKERVKRKHEEKERKSKKKEKDKNEISLHNSTDLN